MKISVQLFGKPSVRVGDEVIDTFPTARSSQLLARLAVAPGKRILRDALAADLWPDEELEISRVRFRQELARLRRTLGRAQEVILADRSFVGLDADRVQVDVDDFLQLVRSAELTTQPRERLDRQRRAAEIALAPFCETCRSPWAVEQRAELDSIASRIDQPADFYSAGPLLGREFDVRYMCDLLTHRLRPGEQFLHIIAPSGFGKSVVMLEVVRRLAPLEVVSLESPTRDEVLDHLAARPAKPIVCASITPLVMPNEHVVRLFTLPVPRYERMSGSTEEITAFPSVKLYLAAAQEAGITIDLTEGSLRSIANLVERLDGWPLPILLAGRRSQVYSASELIGREVEMHAFLVDRRPIQPEHHRSFVSALRWNVEQIPSETQGFLSAFAQLEESFTAREIESTWASKGVEALETLLDFGLVERRRTVEGEGFRLLRPVRDYASSRTE